MKQTQFSMIKWGLYRQKVEEIEDKYADFKRIQKKIEWLIVLIKRNKILKTIYKKFDIHRAKVIFKLIQRRMTVKIRFYFRRFQLKLGANMKARDRNWLRDSLSTTALIYKPKAEVKAQNTLKKFLTDMASGYYMKQTFSFYFKQITHIQKALKAKSKLTAFRSQMLDNFFEAEKRTLIKYYFDKPKKIKKDKTMLQNLNLLEENSKLKILHYYYFEIVVQKNYQNSIYWIASVRKDRETPENNPVYGLLTEEEHRNLIKLAENLKIANEWIFKGTKADAALGIGEKLNEKEAVVKKKT